MKSKKTISNDDLRIIRDYRLMDDSFMEVCFSEKKSCGIGAGYNSRKITECDKGHYTGQLQESAWPVNTHRCACSG